MGRVARSKLAARPDFLPVWFTDARTVMPAASGRSLRLHVVTGQVVRGDARYDGSCTCQTVAAEGLPADLRIRIPN